MEKRDFKKYLIIFTLLLTIYIGYLIIKPFIVALLSSFIFAYLFFPIYKRLKNFTKSEIFSSLLTTVLALIILIIPITYVANSVITESVNLYNQGKLNDITETIEDYTKENQQLSNYISEILTKSVNYVKNQATSIISNITPFGIFVKTSKSSC